MSASIVCKNGIGPGALFDTERTLDQLAPIPPPLTDNHRTSVEWSIIDSKLSCMSKRKHDIGIAFGLMPGNTEFDNTGEANINQPFDTPSYNLCANSVSPSEKQSAVLANASCGVSPSSQ